MRFQSKFLLTYRSFTEPLTLLGKLRERFRSPVPSSLSSNAPEPAELQRLRKVVMMRVVMVIARWIQDFWDDWRGRDDMRALLFAFLDLDVMPSSLAQLASQIKANYLKQTGPAHTPMLTKSATRVIASAAAAATDPSAPAFVFDDGRVLEVAQQMTLRDFERLATIHYDEFLGKKWSKRAREELAPGIVAMTAEFNALSESVVQVRHFCFLQRVSVSSLSIFLSLFLSFSCSFSSSLTFSFYFSFFPSRSPLPSSLCGV